MMSATTLQINTRLDADLKRGGDAVFSRYGLGTSEVIRALWKYVVDHQALPTFLERRQEAAGWADDGCGMAVAMARGLSGHATSKDDATRDATLDAEKDALYDDLLDQMEARCH